MEGLSAGLVARASLEAHGFHTRRTLGQNFLLDDGTVLAALTAAGLGKDESVLEIGPGPGVMTRHMARMCRKVLSVEIDRALEPVLERVLEGADNARVVYADALRADLQGLADSEFGGGSFRVIANIPYYITTPLIEKALALRGVEGIDVMLQKEAAERLLSRPGDKKWCEAAAVVACFGTAEKLLDVPRGSFEPAPHVDSCFVGIRPYAIRPYSVRSGEAMRRVVRAAFAMRRKTMANNLIAAFGVDRERALGLLRRAGLPDTVRGEALSLEELARLADAAASAGTAP